MVKSRTSVAPTEEQTSLNLLQAAEFDSRSMSMAKPLV
jgi:hypothetical protein